jgi:hypothetical protein
MLYANVFWCYAFQVASRVAALALDEARRRACSEYAQHIAQAIELRFGNAHGYASWLDPQHTQHPHRGHNIVLPLQYGLASPERARLTLETIFTSPLWSDDGPLAIEPGFDLAGSAYAWGFTRWCLIAGLFRYNQVGQAMDLMARWIAQEAQAYYQAPESFPTVTGITGKGYVWTAGRAQRALLFGLFGLDLLAEGLRVTPRLPARWDEMALAGLWFRGARYSIRVERGAAERVVVSGVELPEALIPVPNEPGDYAVTITISGRAAAGAA